MIDFEVGDAGIVWNPWEHRPFKVGWDDLELLEAAEPWPSVRLRVRVGRGAHTRTFRPSVVQVESFAAKVDPLFESAARIRPDAISRGWLDVPDVTPEPFAEWPPQGEDNAGPYRFALRNPEDLVIAVRPPGRLERIGTAILGTYDQPGELRPDIVQRAILTVGHLWFETIEGARRRVPVAMLLLRRGTRRGVVYRFGRRTEVLLRRRKRCPVAERLDRRLA